MTMTATELMFSPTINYPLLLLSNNNSPGWFRWQWRLLFLVTVEFGEWKQVIPVAVGKPRG